MNWFEKISQKSLVDEIGSWGWSEDQLHKDGVSIFRRNNEFFIDLGDWANVEVDDLKGAIKRVYPGASVDCDYESGPQDDSWERVF